MRAASVFSSILSSVVALTLFADTTGSWERDHTCVFPISDDVAGLVEKWHQAVQARDVSAITATYSPDAILMGLGEHSIRLGRREISEHYEQLLRDPLGVTLQSRVIEGSCSAAIVTGLQQIRIGHGTDAARAEVAYKMMYAFGDGAWLLIHHHLEPLSEFIRPQSVAQVGGMSRVQTATLPEPPTPLTLPSPAFQLSAAPPVFMPKVLPGVLSSTRPTEPVSEVDISVPPLSISTGPFPMIAPDNATAAKPVDIVVLTPKVDIGAFPMVAGPAPAVPSTPASAAPPIPQLNIEIGAFPFLAQAAPKAVAMPLLSRPEPSLKMTPSPSPAARSPAVASFAQRAATAAKPTPVAPKPQVEMPRAEKPQPVRSQALVRSPAPAVAPPPTTGSSYRPVRRWEGQLPIFETD